MKRSTRLGACGALWILTALCGCGDERTSVGADDRWSRAPISETIESGKSLFGDASPALPSRVEHPFAAIASLRV